MEVLQQDWIEKWAIYSPDEEAISEFETSRSLTYQALNNQANHLAQYLTQTHKLQRGDRVAVLSENCLEYVVLFSVVQKTGITLVPLNYRLAPTEISYLIQDSQPALLIYEEQWAHLIEVPPPELSLWTMEDFSNWLAATPQEEAPYFVRPVAPDHPAFILYTSGTTGFPKGALYTHRMLFWNSINTAMSLIVNSDSRTINCMPPFHTGGWNVLLTPFLHHGGYTCLMKKFDAEAVLGLMEQEKPTLFMGVPTMLKMIAGQKGFSKADLSSLYYIIVGGEPMPIPLIEKWHEKKVFIRQGFGMTEVGPNLTSLHQRDAIRKKGSIGRPNFYVQIKIVNAFGQKVPIGEAGELLLKGPMVTPGYWRNEAATQKAFRDGWFYTGDMVRQDEDGYLYVVDRIKNMFISGGENVYPAEVERVLLQHPNIQSAAVIGVPHPKWGETGKAFVVTNQPVSESEIIDHCTRYLAKFKVPAIVEQVDELPLSPTGKINRRALK